MMDQDSSNETNRLPATKDQDLKEKASLFDIDGNEIDLKKDFQYSLLIPKESKDKILSISRTIKVAVLTIQGFEEIPSGEREQTLFKRVKLPLASSDVIKHFESLLKPYSDESNIIGKQEWESFEIQAMADWRAFYIYCMREKATPDINLRSIYRVFQGCLFKIGEITCDNPQNMNAFMTTLNNPENEGVSGGNPFS